MENTVTFERVALGEFKVLLNGQPTRYTIHNGSLGLSGRDTANVYLIHNHETGKIVPIGSLQSCKKAVTYSLTRSKGPRA
jgi:hypothetical protein